MRKIFIRYTSLNLVILSFLFVLLHTGIAGALLNFTESDLQKVNIGQHFRDTEIKLNPTRCSSELNSINSNVFYIGDSLTFGMTIVGDLLQKTQEAGFGASAEYDVTEALNGSMENKKVRAVGSSVEATGGYNIPSTIEALSQHPADLSPQYTGIIVIGLGTNADDDPARRINELLEYVRGINETADIYWVNTYFKPDESRYSDVNEAIQQVQSERADFTIIDFAAAAAADPDTFRFTTDQVHHTGEAYKSKSDFILQQLAAGPGGNSSTCAKNSSGDNVKDAFDYLSKVYGPTIAAGIVANIQHESTGANPLRMQCIYSVDDGVSKGIDASLLESDGGVRLRNFDAVLATLITPSGANCDLKNIGSVGWGIVQWTPFSKVVDASRAAGVADELIEDLFYQLDFVISQLEGTEPAASAGQALKAVGDELKTATSPERAAEIFAVRYEGCRLCQEGESQYAARSADAIDILTRYGSL